MTKMTNDDVGFMSLFGVDTEQPAKSKSLLKPAPAKKSNSPRQKASEFKTTRRVVGGDERSDGVHKAVMVFGGMVLEIPEEAFLAWMRGMEGNGWSSLRYDEHQDIVGGMREMVRRMGIASRQASTRMEKRAQEKPEDEPDLDKLLDDL